MAAHHPIVPCLWFDDDAEAAAALYVRLFGGRVVRTARYPEGVDNPSGKAPGSVITVEIEVGGLRLTLLDGGPMFRPNPTVSFFVFVDSEGEARRCHEVLIDGGRDVIPLRRWPWSPLYAWVEDRFGVSWQIMTSPGSGSMTIVPCVMFSGPVHGRAAEAMAHWAGVLGGAVDSIERYEAGEGPAGFVKHGRLTLRGQPLIVMDSHAVHDDAFDEGVSLQVMCRDQAGIDAVWDGLVDGGAPSACGWLTDRFGFSWQVVPEQMATWMTAGDAAARARVFAAMMPMQRLDMAVLDAAFTGIRRDLS